MWSSLLNPCTGIQSGFYQLRNTVTYNATGTDTRLGKRKHFPILCELSVGVRPRDHVNFLHQYPQSKMKSHSRLTKHTTTIRYTSTFTPLSPFHFNWLLTLAISTTLSLRNPSTTCYKTCMSSSLEPSADNWMELLWATPLPQFSVEFFAAKFSWEQQASTHTWKRYTLDKGQMIYTPAV